MNDRSDHFVQKLQDQIFDETGEEYVSHFTQ